MKKIFFALSSLALLIAPCFALAQSESPEVVNIGNPLAPGFNTSQPASNQTGEEIAQGFLGNLLRILMIILSALAVFPTVIGGIQLITSQGNADKAAKGKKTLFWGILGLAIGLTGFIIINALLTSVLSIGG